MKNTTTTFLGYYEETKLPIKAGDMVKLPKGTIVECRGKMKEVTRSYTAKVHHVLPGRSIPVGYFNEGAGHVALSYMRREDAYLVKEICGTDKLEELWPLMTLLKYDTGASSIMLPIDNPSICWAGSGGYWTEADINQIVAE